MPFGGRHFVPPTDFTARQPQRGEPVFPYAAAQRAAALVGQKDESQILVQLYNQIRTYFSKNF